ncbi:hypothetical protein ElyMa_002127400 [Elysia marginata]|uniref:Uncharacterized protein n=1 Tax=Elysia marginata TaxID=1093978 RepID=A0AAV4FJ83_9GAST|nr:hypothetical protein ElyMa_002127400 [Elysia marginata]
MAGGGTGRVMEEPVVVSLNQKLLEVVMRPQGIKRWNKVEQLTHLANLVTAQVEKKNQKTLTLEWMETSNLEMDPKILKCLEDLIKNLKIYGIENFHVILGSYLSPLQKEKTKLCQR